MRHTVTEIVSVSDYQTLRIAHVRECEEIIDAVASDRSGNVTHLTLLKGRLAPAGIDFQECRSNLLLN
jgi:hypothetical protein